MKKLLIVGASILQLPAIVKAKELGYYTIVADYDPNAIGIQYADEYYNVSTIDEEGITNLALKIKPDGIITLATDMPMRAIAKATSALNLPGISYETAVKATDKGEMIKAFEAHGVEHPWFYIAENKSEFYEIIPNITYPCVIKPTDNAGNRGVCYIGNESELIKQYEYSRTNSRSGHVIIEEYMAGQEVSVEIIVSNGVVNVIAVTDKLTLGQPYFVEVGHSQPSRLPIKDVEKIKDLATRAVKAIGIDNSPAHVEIMLTKDGPKMVELGARLGGGCITTHLVPLSTGVDMIHAIIDLSLGISPNLTKTRHSGSALRHISGVQGTISSIQGIQDALTSAGVTEVTMLKNIGDHVRYFQNGSDRIGYVIASGNCADESIKNCEEALSKIIIRTE